jgi:hypothetical protein
LFRIASVTSSGSSLTVARQPGSTAPVTSPHGGSVCTAATAAARAAPATLDGARSDAAAAVGCEAMVTAPAARRFTYAVENSRSGYAASSRVAVCSSACDGKKTRGCREHAEW